MKTNHNRGRNRAIKREKHETKRAKKKSKKVCDNSVVKYKIGSDHLSDRKKLN